MKSIFLIDEIKCPICGDMHTITKEFIVIKRSKSIIKRGDSIPESSYLRYKYKFDNEFQEIVRCGIKQGEFKLTYKFKGNAFLGIEATKLK